MRERNIILTKPTGSPLPIWINELLLWPNNEKKMVQEAILCERRYDGFLHLFSLNFLSLSNFFVSLWLCRCSESLYEHWMRERNIILTKPTGFPLPIWWIGECIWCSRKWKLFLNAILIETHHHCFFHIFRVYNFL